MAKRSEEPPAQGSLWSTVAEPVENAAAGQDTTTSAEEAADLDERASVENPEAAETLSAEESPAPIWLEGEIGAGTDDSSSEWVPRRHFLGWGEPLVRSATEWLFEHALDSGAEFGFADVLIVVPGRRSGRKLLEHLVKAARSRGRLAMSLPEITTPGSLPERFLDPGQLVLADAPSRALLADALRRSAQRAERRFTVEEALGELPDAEDLVAWLELAQRLEAVRNELGTLGIGIGAARTRLQQHLDQLDDESARWSALAQVDRWLVADLLSAGGTTRSSGRMEALRRQSSVDLASPRRVVLVGLAEFSVLFRRVLQLGAGCGVEVLVNAPKSECERFDRWGTPLAARWSTRSGPLVEAMRQTSNSNGLQQLAQTVVQRPADQVASVLSTIERWGRTGGDSGDSSGVNGGAFRDRTTPPSEITVGVGEETSAQRLLEAFKTRGIPGHSPFGVRLRQCEPVLALRRLSRFGSDRNLRSLYDALMVPVIARWVDHRLDNSVAEIDGRHLQDQSLKVAWTNRDWVSLVERAIEMRLGGEPAHIADSQDSSGVAAALDQSLAAISDAALDVFDATDRPMRLNDCASGLLIGLRRLYLPPDHASMGDTRDGARVGDAGGEALEDAGGLENPEGLDRTAALDHSRALDDTEAHDDTGPLEHVGEGPSLTAHELEQRALVRRALERCVEVLQEASSLGATVVDLPEMRLDDACSVLFFERGERLSGDKSAQGKTLEVIGWLELALDDSSVVIVTDLNEGSIPARGGSDPLLPESTRSVLGLNGDQARLARDAFLLTALLNSRRRVLLSSCQQTELGEPLLPSRLLLTGEGAELAARVTNAFGQAAEAAEAEERSNELGSQLWLTGGLVHMSPGSPGSPVGPEDSGNFAPREPDREALLSSSEFQSRIRRLRVTDFKAYLACPYRFFLRRILRVRPAPVWGSELDPGRFGTLVHEVLRQFGTRPESRLEEAAHIADCLSVLTDRVLLGEFGPALPTPARIQIEHLRRRFERFSKWHAFNNAAGWRMEQELAERELRFELQVDGEPVEIVGRIDRVDRHPELGLRLLDYKTSDSPADPKNSIKTEITGDGEGGTTRTKRWVDFQLPLYRELARRHPELFDAQLPIETGFVRLSKKLRARSLSVGDWTEHDFGGALEDAREVVRSIRRAVFWPPALPPKFADGLEWVAGDTLPLLGTTAVEVNPGYDGGGGAGRAGRAGRGGADTAVNSDGEATT